MRIRLLFTLGLVLFLSALASPNVRFCAGHKGHPKVPRAVTSSTETDTEYHTLLINKLLYI